MKVMSADISPCLRAVSNVFGDIGADSQDLNLSSARIVMGVTGTKHATAAGMDTCGPPPPCSPSTAAPVDQLLAISPPTAAADGGDGLSHQLQLCLRTSGVGDAVDCPCVHCGQKSESDGSDSCGLDPADGDRHPSCRTQLPDPDEIRAVQADWSELRQNIRQFYWLYMDAAAATSAHHHSSEQARAAAAQLQPVVQDKVGRLSQRDPHQLFVRLNGQLLELAGEVRSRLLQQLGQRPQPQLPEAFIVQLLEHYDDMVSAAVSLTPALSALQRYHMDRFGLTWQTLNEYAYQSIVYMEPMVANNLPTMLSQVRYAHPTCARSSRLVLRYVDFDDQMTAAAELWSRAEPQLQEYGQELASRRAKHRLLREDWEMLRAQKKLLRQEAGGRPAGEAAAGSASPCSLAAGALVSSSEIASAAAESTNRSPADGQIHTQTPPAPPPLPPPAHSHCSSRSCCTKKSSATQVSSSSMSCTSGGGGTSSSLSNGTDSSSSSAAHQSHHSHHTQHKHSASSIMHKHGGGAAVCPVGAHGGGGKQAADSCAVSSNPDQWLELGDDLNDSCSEQSSSTASQHCCCCCCELFGHNNGAGQAPVSRNYPEMRDRLRLRLDQRRQRESAGGKCADGGGSPDQCAGGEGDAVSAGSCGHNQATTTEQVAPAAPPQRDERDLGDLLQYIESDDRQKQERRNEKRAAKRDRQRIKRLEQRASDERRQDQMRSIQEFQRRNPEVTITVVNSANGGPTETPRRQTPDDRPISPAAAVSSPPSPLSQSAKPPQSSTPPRQSKDTACEPLSSPQSQPPPVAKKSALLESLSNSADGSAGEGTGDNKMVTIRRVMEPGLGEPKVTITLKGDSPDKDRVLMTLVNGQMRGDEPSRRPEEPEKPMTKTAKKKLKKALKLEKLKEEEEAAERARQEAAEEEARRLRQLEEQKLLEEQRQQQLLQQKKNKKKKKGSGNNGSVQTAIQSQVQTVNGRGKAAGKISCSNDAQVSKSSATGRPQETMASRVQISSVRSPAIVESNKSKPQQASPPMTNGVMTPRVNGFSAPATETVGENKKNKKKKAANNSIASAATAVTGSRPVVENGVHPVPLEPPTQLMRDLTLSSDSEIEELARTYRIPAGISITRVPATPPQIAGRSYSGVTAAPPAAAASSSAPAPHDAAADDRKSKKKRRKKKTSGEELQLAPDVTIRKVEAGQRPRGSHLDDYESVFMPSAGVTDSVDQEVEAFKRFCLDGPQVNREHRPKVNLNIKDIFIKMKPS